MRRTLVLAAIVAGLLPHGASSAEAPTRTVSMPGKVFEPSKIDVLVGTTVTWKNDDSTNHTATADGDAFASGFIPPGGSFSFAFTREGRYPFHCSIHRFMRGEVNVFGLVLAGPEGPVTAGSRVVFAGLAPPGTGDIVLRGGSGDVTVRARADGSFVARIAVAEPAVFRARAGALSSPRVAVTVRPRVTVTRSGRAVRARAIPARPGAPAILQAYDRERFAWVAVTRGKLDARSSARFTLEPGLERVRVFVRGDKGWADSASTAVIFDEPA
jgi:plastocyanin